MSGLSHGRLRQQGSLQWPCPLEESQNNQLESIALTCDTQRNISQNDEESKGLFSNLFRHKDETLPGKRLYTDGRFNTPDGRAKFSAFHSKGLAEPADPAYPFVLTTGRLYEHWHTMTRTGRIAKIMKKQSQPFLEIHPKDAAKLGVEEEMMLEVRSRRGMARFPVRITKAIVPGTVFVPMHWGALWTDNGEANLLTHPEACPISLEPELKACAVHLTPILVKDSLSDRAENNHKIERENLAGKSISALK
nr:molybdopterin dinucleotide binding domain-containing protein [Waterburya agarophytonicola]